MKQYLLFLFLILMNDSKGQGSLILKDKPFVYKKNIDTILWNDLSKNNLFTTLPRVDQEGFYWTNYFRKNPKRFFDEVIKEFVNQFPEAKTPEVNELEREIKKSAQALPLLYPDKGLLLLSSVHSADLVKRGALISHRSSTGKEFSQRINEVGQYKCGAENIYVGSIDPLEALITLLLDHGVPDRGHRRNLLDSRFERMGLSFPSLFAKQGLMVQDFACL